MRPPKHPACAGLGTKIGRPRRGRASAEFIAGYNAALYAACNEGESIVNQSEPKGLQTEYLDGWRTALGLCSALGFSR